MYNVFWRHALFVQGQSFSVRIFDRSRSGCQVIRLGAGEDFRGPSGLAFPLPPRVSLSRARSFSRPPFPSACYAGYRNFCRYLFINSNTFAAPCCITTLLTGHSDS